MCVWTWRENWIVFSMQFPPWNWSDGQCVWSRSYFIFISIFFFSFLSFSVGCSPHDDEWVLLSLTHTHSNEDMPLSHSLQFSCSMWTIKKRRGGERIICKPQWRTYGLRLLNRDTISFLSVARIARYKLCVHWNSIQSFLNLESSGESIEIPLEVSSRQIIFRDKSSPCERGRREGTVNYSHWQLEHSCNKCMRVKKTI
jgi:hypothetical protein